MSDIPCWISVDDKMPEDRIRVIAADKLIVIGDCFFGEGSGPTMWSEQLGERVIISRWPYRIWRYTLNEFPCPIPTHWIPLPSPPKEELSENVDQLNKKEELPYMFDDIKDYEDSTGIKVNEAFKLGWSMARSKMPRSWIDNKG
jgi:hypothetical protein